jgi:hypothetical protein
LKNAEVGAQAAADKSSLIAQVDSLAIDKSLLKAQVDSLAAKVGHLKAEQVKTQELHDEHLAEADAREKKLQSRLHDAIEALRSKH